MTNRMQTGIVLSLLFMGVGACSDHGPTAPLPAPVPATPTPAPRPPDPGPVYTLSNVTLSGVVFEETPNGRAPIGGVGVYCEPCGAETHTWASTDSNGLYSFTGVWTDAAHFPTRLWVGKDGYVDPEGLPKTTAPNPSGPGWREVVVNGDTRFDVQLVRR